MKYWEALIINKTVFGNKDGHMLQTGQKYAPQIFKLGQTAKGAGTFHSAGQSKKGNLVLALLSIWFSWNFYQIIFGTKYE